MIDDIAIDLWFSENFASMDIRKKCNSTGNLSKFTSNENILSGVVAKLCHFLMNKPASQWPLQKKKKKKISIRLPPMTSLRPRKLGVLCTGYKHF